MPSLESGFSSNIDSCFRMLVCLRLWTEAAQQLRYWIEKLIHHALFQRDNGVIGNLNVFRTDMGAAFGDVAVADVESFSQLADPVFGVERMHFKGGDVDEKAWADEFGVLVMIAEDMADILAEI